jgi:hypothetical protein
MAHKSMIETWRDIPGFFDFWDVYDMAVQEAHEGDVLVEVGTYLGKSAAYMVDAIRKSGKQLLFYVVDTWDPVIYARWWQHSNDPPRPWPVPELVGKPLFEAFRYAAEKVGASDGMRVLRMASTQATRRFGDGSVRFAFLDADHQYEAIKSDIAAWLPKVKPGGILAGHDYLDPLSDYHPLVSWPGVTRAVDEAFGSRVEKRGERENSWLVRV